MVNTKSHNNPILIVHGLGDTLLLFPLLYDFFLQNNKKKLNLVVARKYGVKSFWGNISFINKVYEIEIDNHPRYWNFLKFFLFDYDMCLRKAKAITHENSFIFIKITLFPLFVENILSFFLDRHKLSLGYKELKIKSTHQYKKINIEDFFIHSKENKVLNYLKKIKVGVHKYIIIHRKTFGDTKSIQKSQIENLTKKFPKKNFLIIMNKEMMELEKLMESGNLQGKNIQYISDFDVIELFYLLKFAQCSIVIDSAMMHLSQFTNTPTLALFKVKKVKPKLIVPFAKNIIPVEVHSICDESNVMSEFITHNTKL